MRLWQLQEDLTSLLLRESVYPHTAQQLTLTEEFLLEAQWRVLHKIGEPWRWFSYNKYRRNALNRICPSTWYLLTSQKASHYKQGSKVEQSIEINVLWPLHEAPICLAYRNEGELLEPFEIGNGGKRSCVLALILFLSFLSMVLSDA